MKLRTFSAILLTTLAACGGGDGGNNPPIVLPDGSDQPPPGFANSKNDMVYFNATADQGQLALTPQEDSPDNQAAPLAVTTAGKAISGEMGIGGDHGDEYFERDTYLIHTAADLNQLTVRLDWDNQTADLDYVIFEELTPGGTEADLVAVNSGTLIGDDVGEFQTFNVQPDKNYWLWAGVYRENGGVGPDNTGAGAAPTLPQKYGFSIYGQNVKGADFATCNVTEGADATNDTLTVNGEIDPAGNTTGVAEGTNPSITTGASSVFCGSLASNHFKPNTTDATQPGVVDSDSFKLTFSTVTPTLLTIVGATDADKTALAALSEVDLVILDKDKQVFEVVTFTNTHGVLTTTLPPTVDAADPTMETGPKSIAILGLNSAAITAPIQYKMVVSGDDHDGRAPKLTAFDVNESNDL